MQKWDTRNAFTWIYEKYIKKALGNDELIKEFYKFFWV